MRLDEITPISDNAFEILINKKMHDDIKEFHAVVISQIEKYPNLHARDIFGDIYDDIYRSCNDLMKDAAIVYPPGSVSFQRLSQVKAYIID